MFIVITGLDGSGTSTVGKELHKIDDESYLLKTPSKEYTGREIIDTEVRRESCVANMLYYLSSDVYMSDYIRNNCDYKNKNVYLVRYLIDTVVSNRVAGIDMKMDYTIYGNELLVPDLTLFVYADEQTRQSRITSRGKTELDAVLDDDKKRQMFLTEFKKCLPENTIYVNNSSSDLQETINKIYQNIKNIQNND